MVDCNLVSGEKPDPAPMQNHITIFGSQFPNMATHGPQSHYGFSIYRGVLVQWDEDHDLRVLEVLDAMPAKILDMLLIVQEHEGAISFVWKFFVPKGYGEDDNGITAKDGDWWVITKSIAVNGQDDKWVTTDQEEL